MHFLRFYKISFKPLVNIIWMCILKCWKVQGIWWLLADQFNLLFYCFPPKESQWVLFEFICKKSLSAWDLSLLEEQKTNHKIRQDTAYFALKNQNMDTFFVERQYFYRRELTSGQETTFRNYRFTPKTTHMSTIRILNLKCPKSKALNYFLQMNSNSTHWVVFGVKRYHGKSRPTKNR